MTSKPVPRKSRTLQSSHPEQPPHAEQSHSNQQPHDDTKPTHRGLLYGIAFLSFFDRFAASPMLVLMSVQEGTSLATIAAMIAAYGIAYGLGQPIWGILGERQGRRRALLIALSGTLLAGLATILAPTLPMMVAARTAMGLCVGGLYPLLLTLIADTTSAAQRGQAISDLQASSALGTTVATLVAGAIATATNWRVVVAFTCLAATGFFLVLHRQRPAESSHIANQNTQPLPFLASFGIALAPRPLALYALGFVEGGLLLGTLTYLAPAIETLGVAPQLAGSLTAGYGIAVIAGSQLNKTLMRQLPRLPIMIAGALILAVAYFIAGLRLSVPTVIIASVLVGLSNALLHSGLQSWATEVAPAARSTTVAFFACSVFLGAGVLTSLAAPAIAASRYTTVFLVTAIVALLLTFALAIVASHFHRRQYEESL
ncbi:MAG: MFS transporter [Bifidobacterium tibiigranuli]|uniref:MFS transporter n=1 Tax=Bifidobacterium tibiigranuli TaxID=2172043 RepID=UPI0026EC1420|nr:MFS transporter [Bifidobacterium tibiigranuli]MCI1674088.1 MFS transporter [Bifidobacterium tibiigranuli]MCI1712859.1 MFS transporter [Bifidobacterium tibiigranuli]MCI1834167.1 MFS transporter [Bifidobacterium tibiigranuli]